MRAKHPLIQFGRKFICHARDIVADDAHAAIRRLLFSRIVHPDFLCGQEALGICPYHFKQFYDDALSFEFELLYRRRRYHKFADDFVQQSQQIQKRLRQDGIEPNERRGKSRRFTQQTIADEDMHQAAETLLSEGIVLVEKEFQRFFHRFIFRLVGFGRKLFLKNGIDISAEFFPVFPPA